MVILYKCVKGHETRVSIERCEFGSVDVSSPPVDQVVKSADDQTWFEMFKHIQEQMIQQTGCQWNDCGAKVTITKEDA